ncbi:hypothetical protein GCM10027191_27870 [Novilysobacter erysipheiresistens]
MAGSADCASANGDRQASTAMAAMRRAVADGRGVGAGNTDEVGVDMGGSRCGGNRAEFSRSRLNAMSA